MSVPAAGVYKGVPSEPARSAVAEVATAVRDAASIRDVSEAAAAVVAAHTGASAVAVTIDQVPVVVHRAGRAVNPLSPSASAALQVDPAHTRVIPVPLTAGNSTVRLIVVDPAEVSLDGVAETLGLALDLAAVREQASRAERLAALKSDFAAVVGHEIRSPLTSIVGSLQTIERLGTVDQKTLELVRGASARADRLRIVVEDLLITARIDGRGIPVRPRLMSVVDVAREVAGDSGATVTSTGRVPSITTDGGHLRRILTNLIENAVVHTGAPPELSVRERPGGVEMRIADHGTGLPPEVAGDPFSGSHDSSVGLGLGLRIAAGLADALHGSLSHEPTPGGGATFVLTLPLSI